MEYKVNGSIGGYDSVSGSQQNITANLGQVPTPLDTTLDTKAVPSVLVGQYCDNHKNLLTNISARLDGSDKDAGIGTYPIAINGVFFYDAHTTTCTSTAIATVSATDRTFLTGFHISVDSNATADNTIIQLYATFKHGGAKVFYALRKTTLTANHDQISVMFPTPMELTGGTQILLTNTFSVGASAVSTSLYGYTTAS